MLRKESLRFFFGFMMFTGKRGKRYRQCEDVTQYRMYSASVACQVSIVLSVLCVWKRWCTVYGVTCVAGVY